MSGVSGGANGVSTIGSLMQLLIQQVSGATKAIYASAPASSSQPANQFFASPSGSAGTPAFRAITQADLSAIANALPFGASNGITGTSVSVTTPSFTAPSTGVLFVFGLAQTNGAFAAPTGLSASLSGLTVIAGEFTTNSTYIVLAYLPMASGASTTLTMQATTGASAGTGVSAAAFFIPMA